MDDILASATRLCTLARMEIIGLSVNELADETDDATTAGVQLLRNSMLASGIRALFVSPEITETEFLKLARLLNSPPSISGSIAEAMASLSIVHVVLVTDVGPEAEIGLLSELSDKLSEVQSNNPDVPTKDGVASADAASNWVDGAEQQLAAAVAAGDGAKVWSLLHQLEHPKQFEDLATTVALQLVAEEVIAERLTVESAGALIRRAGTVGAEAVFRLLVAAADPGERNKMFELAVSLPAIVEVAAAHLQDSGWYQVRAATALLGEVHEATALQDLTRLLRHDDHRVRLAAVVALGHIGGASARARLESTCFDPVESVRSGALSVVFASSGGDELPPNELVTNNEADELDTALAVITALSGVQTPRARERLIALAHSTGTGLDALQIRLAAIGALAEGHMPEARPVLEQLTGDSHHLIRERAKTALE